MHIATTGTVAGNALKSGAKTMVMATVQRERGSLSEKDVTAGGMRVEAEGGSVKIRKKKTKEDTLLASNQGPDEPVYPRPRDASYFFFSLLLPPSVSFLFLPSHSPSFSFCPPPSPTPTPPDSNGPIDPSFHLSAGFSQVSEARDAQKSRLGWTRFKTLTLLS